MHKFCWFCSCAVAALALAPACAFLDKVDKVSRIPGREEAQLIEPLKKGPAAAGYDARDSVLEASALFIEFGPVRVGVERRRTVVISNPARFAFTILLTTVEGCGFQLASALDERTVIPAGGQLSLVVAFQPAQTGVCSGFLAIEIDSADGGMTRVQLTGKGT